MIKRSKLFYSCFRLLRCWQAEDLERWSASVPERLAECSVELGEVAITLVDKGNPEDIAASFFVSSPPGAIGTTQSDHSRPLLIFGQSVGITPLGHASCGVTKSILGTNHRYATISRQTPKGRKLYPKQTVAHELGHILGLGHTSPAGPLTLMHPRGCLHCGFSTDQCSQIHRSPYVQKQ